MESEHRCPVFIIQHTDLQKFSTVSLSAFCFFLQIYFDFSGYSDMAIGLSKMFNVDLPLNFNSPYKATNISDFWRRWHMTLSRFLRDYLYIRLGGNRKGGARRYLNLMATMLLGGLWHGAAAKFVVWGLVHGAALVITRLVQRSGLPDRLPVGARRGVGVSLPFHVVAAAWVFFGAPSFDGAIEIFRSLGSMDWSAANLGLPALAALAALLRGEGAHAGMRAAIDGLSSLTTGEQIARERGVEPSSLGYKSRAKVKEAV